jgi:hypothetical protein
MRRFVDVAEAELRPTETQGFAEEFADLRKAAGNLDLKLRLRLEPDGRGKSRSRRCHKAQRTPRECFQGLVLEVAVDRVDTAASHGVICNGPNSYPDPSP